MKIIDFRFRPNIPSTVQGMIDHPVFGEMHALFKFHERARSQPIEDIVRDMEAQNVVKGVITSRDAETTYGIASGNKGVIPFLEQYPDRFIGMAGLDPHKGMDAIDELGLYLTTHADDEEALQLYWDYIRLGREGRAKYEQTHGPLSQTTITEGGYTWLDNPWPWDEGGSD